MMNEAFTKLTFAKLEQFRDFLDKQEAKLADALLLATIPAIGSSSQSPLHLHGSGHFRLSQALQVMTTRIRSLHEEKTTPDEWRAAVMIVNQAFWDYVIILEEAVQEVCRHMDAVDLNAWSQDFHQITLSFKELLAHRIEDLVWVYKRVEDLLLAYRLICRKQKNLWMIFGKLMGRFSRILDKSLFEHLTSTEDVLAMRYKNFNLSYEAMRSLIPEIQEKETKFARFPVFTGLEEGQRHLIIQLYRLIALNDKNSKLKTLDQQLLYRTIKNLVKPGQMSAIFRDYIEVIRGKFFNESLRWQEKRDPDIKHPLQKLENETNCVKNLIGSYREILLRSEAGSYSKTRWSFTEWIVGKEPRKTRDLLYLLYQIDGIKKLFSALNLSIEKGAKEKNFLNKQNTLKKQIDDVLHEMGQPLSSRNLIQVKAERLIELLDVADELGGSLGDVRPLISDVLLRAMHFDAKYQVLNEYPRFHELYSIHRGLSPRIYDLEHEKRLKLFNSVVKHIEHWLKEKEVNEHAQEIEFEESTVHEVLQNFLGAVQRSPDERELHEQQLLEYRYLFSQFFHFLRGYESEGNRIRSQFAFVDQYLDALRL